MVDLIIALTSTILITFAVILPIFNFRQVMAQRRARLVLKVVKLRAVKRYYDELESKSLEEIDQEYDLDDLYNAIR